MLRRWHALALVAVLAAAGSGAVLLGWPQWENGSAGRADSASAAPLPAPAEPAVPAAPASAPPQPAVATPAEPAAVSPPQAAPAAPAAPAPAPGAPAATAPAPAPAPHIVEIAGFRSATFGMTEAQVRAAAEKDFNLRPADIRVAENTVEKTRVLIAFIADPLPGGGRAQISYVLGYKSKRLIQVGLVWAKTTDPKLTSARIVENAQELQAYFRNAGYRPDSIALNAPFAKGVVAFRGNDAKGHATVLILQGKIARNSAGTLALTEADQLSLFYSADPVHPDVATVTQPK